MPVQKSTHLPLTFITPTEFFQPLGLFLPRMERWKPSERFSSIQRSLALSSSIVHQHNLILGIRRIYGGSGPGYTRQTVRGGCNRLFDP